MYTPEAIVDPRTAPDALRARNDDIFTSVASGQATVTTLRALAAKYRISRQRVDQIVAAEAQARGVPRPRTIAARQLPSTRKVREARDKAIYDRFLSGIQSNRELAAAYNVTVEYVARAITAEAKRRKHSTPTQDAYAYRHALLFAARDAAIFDRYARGDIGYVLLGQLFNIRTMTAHRIVGEEADRRGVPRPFANQTGRSWLRRIQIRELNAAKSDTENPAADEGEG